VLRYTLDLHSPPPSGSFDITPETQYPNSIPRPGIDTPLSRRSQGENPLSRHSVVEKAQPVSPPRSLSLASITRLSHSLFLFAKKGVRRELHGGPRSPITNLPHLRYTLRPDCDELARSILTSSKFVDFRKICRCDISALTAPRQRCGG
jgi:hypothetical protein